ncbi:hypothetical protein ACFCW6_29925 [Streptomyces sp. NPDC056333]|uniref:hypothetical protein n=1 Tax=Streptomyces sp. NPDC056333 TaxID=3345786 RepID=UPI0035D78785
MTGNEPHAAPRHAVAGTGIDVDAIARAVDHALTKRPTRPRRDVIDAGTDELIGHLRTLMAVEDYGYDQEGRGGVRALFRVAYRNLDLAVRPDGATSDAVAFTYWRMIASLTAAFRDLYVALPEEPAP